MLSVDDGLMGGDMSLGDFFRRNHLVMPAGLFDTGFYEFLQ